MSRRLIAFVAVLMVGGLLSPFAMRWFSFGAYWGILITLGIVAAVAARPAGSPRWQDDGGPGGEFLCDRCQYNDARYCGRPERPNAVRCPEYKAR